MKSSLRKLRSFAFQKSTVLEEKRDHGVPSGEEDLLRASQDMLDMRNCYDSLLSAAAATANSAYEFSEALREMGTCLLDKTSLNDDEESGRVLLMIGRIQFELQKLVDSYRAHIIQTITVPSESLLNELRTVEEMKRQCDDKRDLYKFMLAAHKEKGRMKNAKGENFSSQQLQAVQGDYEEETNLFVFRLKSLKQGQSRSLLTQAARHHAAQLDFFRRGVKSLEVVEPHVKVLAEQQHIDYNFIGLDNDGSDGKGYSHGCNDFDELSFDFGLHEHQDFGSANTNSTEVDQENLTVAASTNSVVEEVLENSEGDSFSFHGGLRADSQSASTLPDKKFDPSQIIRKTNDSCLRKCHSYVLPMPVDAKILASPCSQTSLTVGRPSNDDVWPKPFQHSFPLEPDKPAKSSKDELSSPSSSNILHSMPNESNVGDGPMKLPPSFGRGFVIATSRFTEGASDTRKSKGQAFSGPLTSLIQSPRSSVPPRLFPSISLPKLSSKSNELYELPRPPVTTVEPWRSSTLGGYSGPLVQRSRGPCAAK
ncbi:hypothetical protein HPP92_025289 [Vanilla planifolia]|uniref:BAR domain-containing protein n=1 Tax=Vanilla planifolia TaxID=51239 RepID=A0A835PHQ2_VANPL|nr:hypothetical protein HPP92_025289 [Vanilla planifolia]